MCEILDKERGGGLDALLRDEYWLEFLDEDEQLAVSSLFEAQGQKLSNESGIDLLVRKKLEQDSKPVSVLFPSTATGCLEASGVMQGDRVLLDGIIFNAVRKQIVFPAIDGASRIKVFQVQVDVGGLAFSNVGGIDGGVEIIRLQGEVLLRDCLELSVDWNFAEVSARRAIAHELLAMAEVMLEKASEHVTERKQFGRALGAFQVVRNSLADVHVAIEGSRDMLRVAFQEQDRIAAMVAKAQAGRAALLAARHCQQFCGAMGWTWEFGLHHYVRRTKFIDSVLGSSDSLTRMIGKELLAVGSAPTFSYYMKDNS